MTVTVPDTIKPGGAFPVAMSGDLARPNGASVEEALGATEFAASSFADGSKPGEDPFVFIGVDADGRKKRFGRFRRRDYAFAPARWAIEAGLANGGLSFTTNADGTLLVQLGTERGRLPIGDTGLLTDTVNPSTVFAATVVDTNGRIRRQNLGGSRSLVAGNNNGGLTIVNNPDGSATLSLGTVAGEQPIVGGTARLLTNPNFSFATTAPDIAGRVRRTGGTTLQGSEPETVAARGTKASLSDRLAASTRPDGMLLSERFAPYRLSETRSKIGDILSGPGVLLGARVAPYQLVINFVGNSWLDNPDFFIQRLTRRLRNELGDAGAGFISVERSAADPAVATLVRTGSWTALNAAPTDNVNVPGPAIVQITSAMPGDKIRLTQASQQSDTVALMGLANGATIGVSKNGGAVTTRTLDAVWTNLGLSLTAGDYVDVTVVSDTVTLYGADLRRNQSGVRVNKMGASSSTWPRWLSATAADWQAGLTALGGDLTVMMESINGADSYDATAEVAYTAAMVARVRAALPVTDILMLSPPTTLATPRYSLRDRAYALRAYAAADGRMAHLDLQYVFGPDIADYADAGHAYFTNKDVNHPSIKGRPLPADAAYRFIMHA